MRNRRGRGARIKATRRIRPDLWVGWQPNGIGQVKPNHYGEMLRTLWDNRDNLPYAWRILRKGVCDGCALGVAGFSDWTIEGVHLCTTRLNLLRLNTMGALDPAALRDVRSLREKTPAQLRALGRLPYPMVRRAGEPGFSRVSWDAALTEIGGAVRAAGGDRIGFYMTARGITNETYYAAQKTARFLGTNNVDNAARVCHAPSTGALKAAIGVGATTCSYTDVIESDLIVLFGSDVANAQPVFMKYLYLAKKRGAQIVVVNPFREPGLERYWVPSNVESALFGTKMVDHFVMVNTGGDVAFISGVLKLLADEGGLDRGFIAEHTVGWTELQAGLDTMTMEQLERISGVSVDDMRAFAARYRQAASAVLIWSMGITQHRFGTINVSAVINLGLARGNVGRPGAGLMPIRGHSGVQGGAEMGCYSTALPGGVAVTPESAAALSETYGFPIPDTPGLTIEEMMSAAADGALDVLYSSGGNFLDVLPDPDRVRATLERIPLRVHQDIIVSSQMLVDGQTVILLPAATRYEQRDGGTETTTERRVAFSPEIPGPRVGEARSEWEIFSDLARHVDPERAHLATFESGQQLRDEIARVVPFYDGIQHLRATGDQVQWGGRHLCEGWEFPTSDGRAHFADVAPPELDLPPGRFLLTTRRGKQFNSIVHKQRDPLTGANRDAVFLAPDDAAHLGVHDGDPVLLRSDAGEMAATVKVSAIKPRNAQVFFPEGNVLLGAGPVDVSGVPDYGTTVTITPTKVRA